MLCLYGWAISGKLPVDGLKWRNDKFSFYEGFIKSYDDNSDKGHIFEVDADYPKEIQKACSNLPFLPERVKIDKYQNFLCNLYDKKKYFIQIKSLKAALDTGVMLKKVYRAIEFN